MVAAGARDVDAVVARLVAFAGDQFQRHDAQLVGGLLGGVDGCAGENDIDGDGFIGFEAPHGDEMTRADDSRLRLDCGDGVRSGRLFFRWRRIRRFHFVFGDNFKCRACQKPVAVFAADFNGVDARVVFIGAGNGQAERAAGIGLHRSAVFFRAARIMDDQRNRLIAAQTGNPDHVQRANGSARRIDGSGDGGFGRLNLADAERRARQQVAFDEDVHII